MRNNSNQKRQPKGTKDGGQFAPDVNAESTVDLGDIGDFEPDTPDLELEVVDSLPTEDEIVAANGGLAEIEALAEASDGHIISVRVGDTEPKPKSASKADLAWDVVLEIEDEEFVHVFVKAPDKGEAYRQARLLKPSPVAYVNWSATQRSESLGKLRHRAIWPHGETLRRERGHEFVKASMLEDIPDLYAQEHTPLAEQTVHAHFFSSNGDWYITEIDKDEGLAFGHCDLGMGFPEWGYVSLVELEEARGRYGVAVERDTHFQPKTAGELGIVEKGG